MDRENDSIFLGRADGTAPHNGWGVIVWFIYGARGVYSGGGGATKSPIVRTKPDLIRKLDLNSAKNFWF